MARTYAKVFFDWRKQMAALSDAERGRLYDAILEYGETGIVPELGGRESILFPVFQSQLDRDMKSYQNKVSGAAQAREAKDNHSDNSDIRSNHSDNSDIRKNRSNHSDKWVNQRQEEEKEEEEEKEKDISPPPSSSENKGLQTVVREWDKARGGITSCAEGERIADLFDTYGEQAMLYAIRQAVDHDAVRIAYVEAVLRRAPYTRDLTEEEKRRNREAILNDE